MEKAQLGAVTAARTWMLISIMRPGHFHDYTPHVWLEPSRNVLGQCFSSTWYGYAMNWLDSPLCTSTSILQHHIRVLTMSNAPQTEMGAL